MFTQILIADDHPMTRYGLKSILNEEPDMRVIGEAGNGLEVIKLAQELEPNLVILDVMMPKMDGIQAIQILSHQFPKMKFLVMSSFSYGEIQNESLRVGAANFISKNRSSEEIIETIRASMYKSGTKQVCQECSVGKPEIQLTPAEYKVLILLSEGLDRNQIAERLGVSYDTIKTHLRHIYRKLGVSSNFEAVRVALKNGLIS